MDCPIRYPGRFSGGLREAHRRTAGFAPRLCPDSEDTEYPPCVDASAGLKAKEPGAACVRGG